MLANGSRFSPASLSCSPLCEVRGGARAAAVALAVHQQLRSVPSWTLTPTDAQMKLGQPVQGPAVSSHTHGKRLLNVCRSITGGRMHRDEVLANFQTITGSDAGEMYLQVSSFTARSSRRPA